MDHMKLLDVLVLEDTPYDQNWIRGLLERYKVGRVDVASTYEEAIELLRSRAYNCMIIDIRIKNSSRDGIALLEEPVAGGIYKIVFTRVEPNLRRRALLLGARRFIEKSELERDPDQLQLALFDASIHVTSELDIVYQSVAMSDMIKAVAAVARRSDPVLICGESGTGKELVARSLHALGPRSTGPFEAVNCACLDGASVMAELFGVAKGGFTGVTERPGIFERAHGGDVFLDEVGDLKLEEQARLLRVLEHPAELLREGSAEPARVRGEVVRFRVISATDKDLSALVERERFRKPLLERILSQVIEVPPLNKRREDIPLLVRHFLRRNREAVSRISEEAVRKLEVQDWTGSNVRGLWNVLSRSLVRAELRSAAASATVEPADIEAVLKTFHGKPSLTQLNDIDKKIESGEASMKEVEAYYIRRVLHVSAWDVSEAASRLGIGRNTLYEKMKRYGLFPDRKDA